MESIRKKHRSHRYCSVPGCKARSSNDISLFLFPKSIELAKKWAEILSIHDRVAKYNYVCSLHFRRNDFTVSTSANKRRLKMGAIPSKNLPISSNGIQLPQFIDKDTKWEQKISVRKMFNETNLFECRGCLQPCSNEEKHDLFKSWHPPWPGMENTLAEDLSKLACIQIMKNDPHSKVLCESCFKHLQNACQFVEIVKKADEVLNLRMDNNTESWPKPIQIDKNVPFENVEIKNEILSDNEGQINEDFSNVDVKIEADDWPSQQVHINGTISLSSLNKEMNQVNGKNEHFNNERNANKLLSENETFDINNSNVTVKSEPLSDVEENDDLTMDCILCSKTFLSITGLKAHVIANHTYKTVRRKGLDEIDEMKLDYACDICQRRFETSTDLMVHKTCHNKCICSGCSLAFETIDHLSQHRLFCKAVKDREVGKVLKLEDVQRMANVAQRILEVITKCTIYCQNSEQGNIDECYQALLAVITQKDDMSDESDDDIETSDVDSDYGLIDYNRQFFKRKDKSDFQSINRSYPIVKITRLESPILGNLNSNFDSDTSSNYEEIDDLDDSDLLKESIINDNKTDIEMTQENNVMIKRLESPIQENLNCDFDTDTSSNCEEIEELFNSDLLKESIINDNKTDVEIIQENNVKITPLESPILGNLSSNFDSDTSSNYEEIDVLDDSVLLKEPVINDNKTDVEIIQENNVKTTRLASPILGNLSSNFDSDTSSNYEEIDVLETTRLASPIQGNLISNYDTDSSLDYVEIEELDNSDLLEESVMEVNKTDVEMIQENNVKTTRLASPILGNLNSNFDTDTSSNCEVIEELDDQDLLEESLIDDNEPDVEMVQENNEDTQDNNVIFSNNALTIRRIPSNLRERNAKIESNKNIESNKSVSDNSNFINYNKIRQSNSVQDVNRSEFDDDDDDFESKDVPVCLNNLSKHIRDCDENGTGRTTEEFFDNFMKKTSNQMTAIDLSNENSNQPSISVQKSDNFISPSNSLVKVMSNQSQVNKSNQSSISILKTISTTDFNHPSNNLVEKKSHPRPVNNLRDKNLNKSATSLKLQKNQPLNNLLEKSNKNASNNDKFVTDELNLPDESNVEVIHATDSNGLHNSLTVEQSKNVNNENFKFKYVIINSLYKKQKIKSIKIDQRNTKNHSNLPLVIDTQFCTQNETNIENTVNINQTRNVKKRVRPTYFINNQIVVKKGNIIEKNYVTPKVPYHVYASSKANNKKDSFEKLTDSSISINSNEDKKSKNTDNHVIGNETASLKSDKEIHSGSDSLSISIVQDWQNDVTYFADSSLSTKPSFSIRKENYKKLIGKKSKIVFRHRAKREIGPSCTSRCTFKCSKNFSPQQRLDIFNDFWKLDVKSQSVYLDDHVYPFEKFRICFYKHKYEFPLNHTSVRVCGKFFENTLSLKKICMPQHELNEKKIEADKVERKIFKTYVAKHRKKDTKNHDLDREVNIQSNDSAISKNDTNTTENFQVDVTNSTDSNVTNIKATKSREYNNEKTEESFKNNDVSAELFSFIQSNFNKITIKRNLNMQNKPVIIGKGYKFVFIHDSPKSIKSGCNCKHNCSEKINPTERKFLLDNFCRMNIKEQTSYLNRNVFLINPISRLGYILINHKFFLSVLGKRVRVCRDFFTNTLYLRMLASENFHNMDKILFNRLNPQVKLVDISLDKTLCCKSTENAIDSSVSYQSELTNTDLPNYQTLVDDFQNSNKTNFSSMHILDVNNEDKSRTIIDDTNAIPLPNPEISNNINTLLHSSKESLCVSKIDSSSTRQDYIGTNLPFNAQTQICKDQSIAQNESETIMPTNTDSIHCTISSRKKNINPQLVHPILEDKISVPCPANVIANPDDIRQSFTHDNSHDIEVQIGTNLNMNDPKIGNKVINQDNPFSLNENEDFVQEKDNLEHSPNEHHNVDKIIQKTDFTSCNVDENESIQLKTEIIHSNEYKKMPIDKIIQEKTVLSFDIVENKADSQQSTLDHSSEDLISHNDSSQSITQDKVDYSHSNTDSQSSYNNTQMDSLISDGSNNSKTTETCLYSETNSQLDHKQSESQIELNSLNQGIKKRKASSLKLQRIIGKGYKFMFRYTAIKSLRPSCNNCYLKCSSNIAHYDRRILFENFWAMSVTAQTNFLNDNVFLVNPILGLRDIQEARMKRNHKFFLPVRDKRIRVCKKFFQNTLSIFMADLKDHRLQFMQHRLNPQVKLIDIGVHTSLLQSFRDTNEFEFSNEYMNADLCHRLDNVYSPCFTSLPKSPDLQPINIVNLVNTECSDSEAQSPKYAELSTVDSQRYDCFSMSNNKSDQNKDSFITGVFTQPSNEETSFKTILEDWASLEGTKTDFNTPKVQSLNNSLSFSSNLKSTLYPTNSDVGIYTQTHHELYDNDLSENINTCKFIGASTPDAVDHTSKKLGGNLQTLKQYHKNDMSACIPDFDTTTESNISNSNISKTIEVSKDVQNEQSNLNNVETESADNKIPSNIESLVTENHVNTQNISDKIIITQNISNSQWDINKQHECTETITTNKTPITLNDQTKIQECDNLDINNGTLKDMQQKIIDSETEMRIPETDATQADKQDRCENLSELFSNSENSVKQIIGNVEKAVDVYSHESTQLYMVLDVKEKENFVKNPIFDVTNENSHKIVEESDNCYKSGIVGNESNLDSLTNIDVTQANWGDTSPMSTCIELNSIENPQFHLLESLNNKQIDLREFPQSHDSMLLCNREDVFQTSIPMYKELNSIENPQFHPERSIHEESWVQREFNEVNFKTEFENQNDVPQSFTSILNDWAS